MTTFPVVVSFYTKNTPYEQEVQNLIASCEKWNLAYSIEGIDSQGSWELNCAYKPFFLIKKLEELKCPILWVDADGVFVRAPNGLVFQETDFAVRINEECEWNHPSKVISSTIFINSSEGARRILGLWAEECIRQLKEEGRKEEFWDQIALRNVLQLKNFVANVRPMPLAYAKIFDHVLDNLRIEESVIEHFQASRRHKEIINHRSHN
jgi:hypothetical protein